ncbi:MFS transporter [Chitinibacter bivalviorum]|uniref:MFS transporter n=1 Tax=Chitinibacter bivalviorum TaxID=2739434 RepID=A0A7H9BFL5_9NEIS|nr:MFS transporter [Chitinibacter bivalviorum]QLG87503.1 MFS transporter [Chitinibacter bivalviorum]
MSRLAEHRSLAAYGLLGLPLAMSALPVYVQIPAYYSTQLGLALAGTGWVLFLARLIDTVQDPWLGRCIDGLHGRALFRWLLAGAGVLAFAFAGLWMPLVAGGYLMLWLAVMLVVAYTAHSMLNIAYLAWGARLHPQSNSSTVLGGAAWREAAGLFGVIVASVLPSWMLTLPAARMSNALMLYSAAFATLLLLAVWALLRVAPPWVRVETPSTHWRDAANLMRNNPRFVRLLWPYFLNAISVAVPATLALFFINDRLMAPDLAGVFLALYFVAAAMGLPLWVSLANRIGVLASWRWGMCLAVLAFCSASLLGPGDHLAYAVVCFAAGLALGSDLALPPVALASIIPAQQAPALYYGIWTLLGKLALALAGLSLPLLAVLGYQPGLPAGAELAWVYAGIPCVFKVLALLLLNRTEPSSEASS